MNSSKGKTSSTSQQASPASATHRTLKRTLWVIFAAAVLINLPWEVAQMSLYVAEGSVALSLWYCFLASLGDGLLVLLIFAAGWLVFRRRYWFTQPGVRGYLLMLTTGASIAFVIEWVATGIAGQWGYAEGMPLVLGVGLAPLMQMLVLPPLIFRIVTAWRRHGLSGEARKAR